MVLEKSKFNCIFPSRTGCSFAIKAYTAQLFKKLLAVIPPPVLQYAQRVLYEKLQSWWNFSDFLRHTPAMSDIRPECFSDKTICMFMKKIQSWWKFSNFLWLSPAFSDFHQHSPTFSNFHQHSPTSGQSVFHTKLSVCTVFMNI